jgi:hypothetical protein
MKYEQKNGLLSQWRGYGTNGAFALVFDTARLEAIMKKEFEKYTYINANLLDVIYDRSPVKVRDDYGHIVDLLAQGYSEFIFEGKRGTYLDYDVLQSLLGRLKHRGFFEEREVRFIVYPMYQEYADEYRDNPDLVRNGALKKIDHDAPKPHVALFEDLGEELPITRIIVGPSNTQKEDAAKVEKLVAGKIPIVMSETPYKPV